MTQDHAFHVLLQRPDKTPVEEALVAAITILSVEQYSSCTPEEIFDRLVSDFHDWFLNKTEHDQAFLHMLYRRIIRMEQSLLTPLHRMEKTLTAQSTALTRLQTDNDNLKVQVTTLQTSFTGFVGASTDAYARFQKSLDDLKNQAGDDDALNAIATDMEATLATLKGINDAAVVGTTTAAGEDQPATPPPPPPPTGVVITPSGDVSTTPGNPIQFSANVPVNWTAGAGQIDTSGLYTPAPDPTVTNDTVTATSQADATQTATVNVTIAPAA